MTKDLLIFKNETKHNINTESPTRHHIVTCEDQKVTKYKRGIPCSEKRKRSVGRTSTMMMMMMMMRCVVVVVPTKSLVLTVWLLLLATQMVLLLQNENNNSYNNLLLLPVVSGFHPLSSSLPRRRVSSSYSSLSSSFPSLSTSTVSTKLFSLTNNNNLDDDDDDDVLISKSQQQGRRNSDNNKNDIVDIATTNDSSRSRVGAVDALGHVIKTFSVTMALCFTVLFMNIGHAYAYNDNTNTDYASETVQTTIQALKDAAGDPVATFKAYEKLADIITEGSGLGGSVNFQGVTLDRGYIADEDTAIYNPGLTLLTESEKERLVQAVIASRAAAISAASQQQGSSSAASWSSENQMAFEFLREKLDPYHIQELSGYLQILPFYSAMIYLVVLAVQQLARDFFPVAYFVGVAAVLLPAIVLVLVGPS